MWKLKLFILWSNYFKIHWENNEKWPHYPSSLVNQAHSTKIGLPTKCVCVCVCVCFEVDA